MNSKLERKDNWIKMLIVDDEPVICEGLRHTINWEELGIQVVGEAYEGREALRLLEEHEVDVVLSDIRMEGMDGLQLAERLKERFPEVRVVMISGYEDFEYARQAIRLGVSDYLLKPVEIEELIRVVQKIVTDIRAEARVGGAQEAKLWLSNMARHGIAYGKEAPASLRGAQFRVLVTQLDRFVERFGEQSPESYREIQNDWIQRLHTELGHPFLRVISVFDHENLLVTLAVSDIRLDKKTWDGLLEQALPELRKGNLYCGASEPYDDLEETARRCAEANGLLPYHVVEDEVLLLPEYRDSIEQDRNLPAFDAADMAKSLLTAMFKQDHDEVASQVERMFEFFRKEVFLPGDILLAYEELSALLRQRLRKSGMTELDYGHKANPDLNLFNSYTSLETVVREEMQELLRQIDHYGIDKSYWIIEKAKKYMNEHYRTDLKASEVATWLKITPSYFSYIFKQSTGKGFTEYMNEMRMEQAKALLATTHDKVFEVADKVGYKEYKYFVSVFKSYTGMTPKEYRGLSATRDAGSQRT
ncbi:AraC family two component transcriptional regulator [Fontibacillus phaseoli]|uniref:AraC family two component transcriptional regulator n=1 Tax=Fontibacillus phaseoli TaxID=1416533 RepID=A0A369BM00_9BACL|nr:response regulator [Fontibacillus phaseoli]RCX22632.1 AraC family two component transcriptional regulator [Fontibacillus phaseoli]